MTDHRRTPQASGPPPLTDAELEALLAQARQWTGADTGAAGRFLSSAGWRQARGRPSVPGLRRSWITGGWLAVGLASAALIAGLAVWRPAPPLPASAAYEAYHSALGAGW